MKILHLSKFYPPDKGGLEHVVARLAEGAAAAGHEVRVVSATGSSWIRPPNQRLSETPRNGVTVVRLPTHGVLWSQPVAPGYIAAARWPADILHVHHPHPLADLATLLGPKTPVVITHHSDVRRQVIAKPFYWPLARAVLRRSRAIAVASHSNIRVSEELRGMEDKVHVIPFGVDDRRFAPRAQAPRPAAFPREGVVGLFVGRLVGYKGLDILIKAIAGTKLVVVLAGDGPLRDELQQQVAGADLGEQVRFAGAIEDEDLPGYFQAADYFVLPSTTPAEMFGVVLLEAMACGKPIITTALPTGVREVNNPGIVGLEVPPGDPVALRSAMERIASDPELRQRMGTAARTRVEQKFTLKRMVDDHLALYRQILDHRR